MSKNTVAPATVAAAYLLTGHNSYLFHMEGADGTALCGSTASVTPTDAKWANPRSAIHAECLELHTAALEAAQAAEQAPAATSDLDHVLAYLAEEDATTEQLLMDTVAVAHLATAAAATGTGDAVTYDVELSDTDRIGARRHRLVTGIVLALGGQALAFTARKEGRASTAGYVVRVTVAPALVRTAQVLVNAALAQGERVMNAAGAEYRATKGLTAQQRDSGYQDVRRAALTGYAQQVAAAVVEGRQAAFSSLLASA